MGSVDGCVGSVDGCVGSVTFYSNYLLFVSVMIEETS